MTSKERIAGAFSKAADTYEHAAYAQKTIASRLAEKVMEEPLPINARILEIGCGTGYLSRLLLALVPGGEWLLTDLSLAMVKHCRTSIHDSRVQWRVMDGETPDLPLASFDLIVSSLAFQWFYDTEGSLERLRALLTPQGRLMFATLGNGTFIEWREAHKTLGFSCGLRTFPAAFPSFVEIEEEQFRFTQRDALSFARNFRDIGAQTPDPRHTPLSPAHFRKLARHMGTNFDVTYRVLFGQCRGV